jgi:hypothetical protein
VTYKLYKQEFQSERGPLLCAKQRVSELASSIPGHVRQRERERERESCGRREKRVFKALFLCHRNGRRCVLLRHQEEEIVKSQRRCRREREREGPRAVTAKKCARKKS